MGREHLWRVEAWTSPVGRASVAMPRYGYQSLAAGPRYVMLPHRSLVVSMTASFNWLGLGGPVLIQVKASLAAHSGTCRVCPAANRTRALILAPPTREG
jgi:hypothetical protein